MFKRGKNLEAVYQPRETKTYASSLRTFWAPVGTILLIVGAVCTIAWRVVGPITAKADEKTVAKDEDRLGALVNHVAAHDAATDTRLDNVERDDTWMMQTIYAQAKASGLNPSPIPSPKAVPDPFATPSLP